MKVRSSAVLLLLWGALALGLIAYFVTAPSPTPAPGHAGDVPRRAGETPVVSLSPAALPSADPAGPARRDGFPGAMASTGTESVARQLQALQQTRSPAAPQLRAPRRLLPSRTTEKTLAIIEDQLETRPANEERARIQLVTKLGKLKSQPRAFNRLLAVASSGLTRGERLAAIELLATPLSVNAKATLEKIARSDPDAEVKRRAASVLGRQG